MRLANQAVAAAALGLLAAGGCTRPSAEPAPESTAISASTREEATLAEATFTVKGMTCASCNVAVKVAAEKVPGVREARASNAEGRAWVTYDPARTNPTAIAAAITNAGYEATPAPAGAPAAPVAQ